MTIIVLLRVATHESLCDVRNIIWRVTSKSFGGYKFGNHLADINLESGFLNMSHDRLDSL